MAIRDKMSSVKPASIKAFRRLAYAGLAFRQAHALCVHIERLLPSEATNLWTPLLTGVAVTYAKPFGRCDGLGALPDSFRSFPEGSPHAQVHRDIVDGRNWNFAHRDTTKAADLMSHEHDKEKLIEVAISLSSEGATIHTNEPGWHPHAIPRIRDLCIFQNARVTTAINDLARSWIGTKRYHPGRHILGETFP